MTHPASALRAARRTRPTLLAAVAGTALLGVLGFSSVAGWSSSPVSSASSADGVVVPDGVTVDDDEYPAVTKLDPALLAALRRAAADAASNGVALYVNSGWRAAAYQEKLLDDAVAEYGSREEAARWVATPTTSAHVSGDAVDIGPAEAAAWLSEDGAGVRPVPDLRQRALALRAPLRRRRERLSGAVLRSHPGPANAAVNLSVRPSVPPCTWTSSRPQLSVGFPRRGPGAGS
jgi:zinc D-Ala-D-Ala carboxypeptidase